MATYTYAEVASLLAAAFPERGPAPSVNVLRNAVARGARRGVAGGMPPRSNSAHAPEALFDATAIETWISSTHPWAVARQVTDLWAAGDRDEALRFGRAGGLSWAELASARSAADGMSVSAEAVRRMAMRRSSGTTSSEA